MPTEKPSNKNDTEIGRNAPNRSPASKEQAYPNIWNKKGFPATWIANSFLQRDLKEGGPSISHMKLQKLVYIMHGWCLGLTGKPAVNSYFEAWEYGPVEPNLYRRLMPFGDANIPSLIPTWEMRENDEWEVKSATVPEDGNEEFYKIFDAVFQGYMQYDGIKLSSLTHQRGTPWDETMEKTGGALYEKIPEELIHSYYKKLAAENRARVKHEN